MTSESGEMTNEYAPEDVDHYIEIRGICDVWSVAKMKDGRMLNRWPPDDRRHKAAQDFIDRQALGASD